MSKKISELDDKDKKIIKKPTKRGRKQVKKPEIVKDKKVEKIDEIIEKNDVKKDEIIKDENENDEITKKKIKTEKKQEKKREVEKPKKQIQGIEEGIKKFLEKNPHFEKKYNMDNIVFLPVKDPLLDPEYQTLAMGVLPVDKKIAEFIKKDGDKWNSYAELRFILMKYGFPLKYKAYEGVYL